MKVRHNSASHESFITINPDSDSVQRVTRRGRQRKHVSYIPKLLLVFPQLFADRHATDNLIN